MADKFNQRYGGTGVLEPEEHTEVENRLPEEPQIVELELATPVAAEEEVTEEHEETLAGPTSNTETDLSETNIGDIDFSNLLEGFDLTSLTDPTHEKQHIHSERLESTGFEFERTPEYKKTQSQRDLDKFQEIRSFFNEEEKGLFVRPEQEHTSYDPLETSPYRVLHDGFDRIAVDDLKRGIDKLESLDVEFLSSNSIPTHRAAVAFVNLINQSRYLPARRIAEMFNFSDKEVCFLYAYATAEKASGLYKYISYKTDSNESEAETSKENPYVTFSALLEDFSYVNETAYRIALARADGLTIDSVMKLGALVDLDKRRELEKAALRNHIKGKSPLTSADDLKSRWLRADSIIPGIAAGSALTEDDLAEDVFRNYAVSRADESVKNKNPHGALEIIKSFQLPESYTSQDEVQALGIDALREALTGNRTDLAIEVAEVFRIPLSVLRSPEVLPLAKEYAARLAKEQKQDPLVELRQSRLLPGAFYESDEYQLEAVEGLYARQYRVQVHLENLPEIIYNLGLTEETLNSEKGQAIIEEVIAEAATLGDILVAHAISDYVLPANRERVAARTFGILMVNGLARAEAQEVSDAHLCNADPGNYLEFFQDNLIAAVNASEPPTFSKAYKLWKTINDCVEKIPAKEELEDLGFTDSERRFVVKNVVARKMPRAYNVESRAIVHHIPKEFGYEADEADRLFCEGYRTALAAEPTGFDSLCRYRDFVKKEAGLEAEKGALLDRLERFPTDHAENKGLTSPASVIAKFLPYSCITGDDVKRGALRQPAEAAALLGLMLPQGSDSPVLLVRAFKLGEDFTKADHVQAYGEKALIKCLAAARVEHAAEVIETLKLPLETLNSLEVQKTAKELAIKLATEGKTDKLAKLQQAVPLPKTFWESSDYQQASKLGLGVVLSSDWHQAHEVSSAVKVLSLTEESLYSDDTQAAILACALNKAKSNSAPVVLTSLSELIRPDTRTNTAVEIAGVIIDYKPGSELLTNLISEYLSTEELQGHLDRYSSKLKTLVINFNLKSFQELVDLFNTNSDFCVHYCKKSTAIKLTNEDRARAKALHITLVEADELLEAEVDLERIAEERDFRGLAEAMQIHCSGWRDEANIVKPFAEGASVFGFERMFLYLDYRNHAATHGVNRHDALTGFADIITLREKLDVDVDTFFDNILDQARRDGGEYYSGSSYHHLNQIASQISDNPRSIIQEARKLREHPAIGNLIAELDHPDAPARSWKDLKNYSRLQRAVKQAELIPQLEELRKENEPLYNFISTLAFHPDSNVDIDKAIMFWKRPGEFLGASDAHTSDVVQKHLCPLAYTQAPHLDLTPTELRDALADGTLDRTQRIRPFEMTITLPANPNLYPSTRSALSQAVGNRSKGIHGKARKVLDLYNRVNELLPEGVEVPQYIKGAQVPNEIEQEINELLFDSEIGLSIDTVELVATIHPKSSADGVLAGNDTACCMPFGSGKNNIYMFNLGTAAFTLQLKTNGGRPRTIAQSILRLDQEIGEGFPVLKEYVVKGGKRICEVLPETVLEQSGKSILTADNREPARNYTQKKRVAASDAAYRIFFREYVSRFGKELGLEQSHLPIGINYSITSKHLPKIPNTQAPRSPIGYTDMHEAEAYSLSLTEDLPPFACSMRELVTRPEAQASDLEFNPVQELDFEDTLAVDYLEGSVYEKDHILLSLLNHSPLLMGKDINNASKGRANLSLKYVSKAGRLNAYLVAYEGRADTTGEELIYIEDICADPNAKGAGFKLLTGFLDRYNEHYIQQGKLTPILAELTEGTTYEFITRRIDRLAKRIGVNLEVQELEDLGDGRHQVLIKPSV